ncbi:MAG: DUF721 domain-containing protein [Rhodospirillales bacterium]|nr:DUF721 domain-containing protein [Rhodospirillales bacterium]
MAKVEGKPEGTGADTRAGIATEARHVYGPRPISALIPALTRPAFRRRSPAAAQIMADWPAIVGPVLAEATVPRRLSAGTLTLGCSGPIALELQHMTAELIARINAHAGAQTVKALRFEQMLPPAAPLPAPKPPSPKVTQAAEAAVAHLPAGELRDALAALGRAVLGAREAGRNKPSTADRSRR